MNVRAAAGPEPSASAKQVEPQLAPATEGTESTTPVTATGEGSGDNGASFEDRMRAQIALITAPSESGPSTSADSKIEKSADCNAVIVCPAEIGKFAETKPALLQRVSDRLSRVSAETRPAPRPSKLHDSHGKDLLAGTQVNAAGSLTAESLALSALLTGCEPSVRVMDNPSQNATGAKSFDQAQIAEAEEPVHPTLTLPSNSAVLAGTSNLASKVAGSVGHSNLSSPIVDVAQLLPAQSSIAGKQEKSAGISTQANIANGTLRNEGEQRGNDPSLPPLQANFSSSARPLAANDSEVGQAIQAENKARTDRAPNLVEPLDTKTPPAAVRNQTIDSVPVSLPASDQPVPVSTPSATENGKVPKSFRPSSADEQIKVLSREHPSSAHTVSQANGIALPATEISPIAAVPSRSSHEQSGRFQINDAFAAIESGTTIDSPYRAAQHGGRVQAEAGFQDPSLGWIGVRAETHAGTLHATVLSSSTEAAQALSGHIAGLQAHLAERNTPVESLTFVSTGGPGGQAATPDSREGTHPGAGNQGGRDNTPQGSQDFSQGQIKEPNSFHGAVPVDLGPIRSLGNSIGGRISVLA